MEWKFFKTAHTIFMAASISCIVLVGLAGLYLGPKCVNQPRKPGSICVIVRSSQVGGALIAVGVTITCVFILIGIIEIQTRFFPFKSQMGFMEERYGKRLLDIKCRMSVEVDHDGDDVTAVTFNPADQYNQSYSKHVSFDEKRKTSIISALNV